MCLFLPAAPSLVISTLVKITFVNFKYLFLVLQVKGKEGKEGKEKSGATNGHQFVPVSPSGPTVCVACDKSVSGKELLQCSSKC